MGLSYDQEKAMQAMLEVHKAINALRDASNVVKGLHFEELSPSQQAMIDNIRKYCYADDYPSLLDDFKNGDGTYWRFQNFFVPKPNQ